eukprot:7337372-Alexandrium_andersonii.AAC.1
MNNPSMRVKLLGFISHPHDALWTTSPGHSNTAVCVESQAQAKESPNGLEPWNAHHLPEPNLTPGIRTLAPPP